MRLSLAVVISAAFSITPIHPAAKAETPAVVHQPEYTVDGNHIKRDGQTLTLHGVNWFGFDGESHVIGGLWLRTLPDMIRQMQSLGIDAVRLPICPASLSEAPVTSVNYYINPQLQGLNARQTLLAVSRSFDTAGISILLDYHTTDCSTISPLWYSANHSEAQWIAELDDATKLLSILPHFIGVDLHNEPFGATWGTGNPATDWNLAAERAGYSVLSVDPRILIVVEGIYENPLCSSNYDHFWGGNLEPERCAPIRLPANKTVLSAHIFGTDISDPFYYKSQNFPDNLPTVWDQQFGSLSPDHALLIGEWGGKMGTDGGNPKDLVIQKAFTSYLSKRGICSGFYWSWGPNSRDTGGLLENDWQMLSPIKVNVLQRYFSDCPSN